MYSRSDSFASARVCTPCRKEFVVRDKSEMAVLKEYGFFLALTPYIEKNFKNPLTREKINDIIATY